MAVAYSEFRNLIGRIDNDNRPGFFAVKSERPARAPRIRTDTLELEYANLATRLEPETGCCGPISCIASAPASPPSSWPICRISRSWLRDAFGNCTREEMPFRHLVWALARADAPGTWAAIWPASPS